MPCSFTWRRTPLSPLPNAKAGRSFCMRAARDLAKPGKSGATALHVAAWHGHADMVRLLLEFHAPVNVRDTMYGTSPLGWAAHGSINCRNADDDYCATVAALLDAGADSEASINPWGVRPGNICSLRVARLLKERSFDAG